MARTLAEQKTLSRLFKHSAVFAAVILVCSFYQGADTALAQTTPPDDDIPVKLRPARQLDTKAPTERDDSSVYMSAYRMESVPDETLTLIDDAEVRKGGSVIKGDKITYTFSSDEVHVVGNAYVSRSSASFEGPELTYRLDAETGSINDTKFKYLPNQIRGSAKSTEFLGDGKAKMCNAIITTCKEGDRSWWIETEDLDLDFVDEEAWGKDAYLYLHGIPVFRTPIITFPLSAKRRSGFLVPQIGVNTSLGFNMELPFYWNIAPNYDFTETFKPMTKRGMLFGNQFRYLQPSFGGQIDYDIMFHDKNTGSKRYYLGVKHTQVLPWDIKFNVNYNRVSDDNYLSDFSRDIRESSEDVLKQNIWLSINKTYWSTSLGVYKNQTLRPDGYYVEQPYQKVPEFKLRGFVADLKGFSVATGFTATRFESGHNIWGTSSIPRGKSRSGDGDRFMITGEASYPMLGSWWFLTPKVEYNAAWYNRVTGGKYNSGSTDIHRTGSRTIPIYTLDAGLIFERNFTLIGREMEQTLEPRLYYAYIPYRDQKHLANFESSEADLSFATLFTANRYTGYDRISDANQLTAALTTRFIDSSTGKDWFNATIGQRYYFRDQKVGIYWADSTDTSQRSDILGATEFTLIKDLRLELSAQYSTTLKTFNKTTAGFRYNPEKNSIVSFFYRYNFNPNDTRDPYYNSNIKQVDLSFQWPLFTDFYGLGRYAWSIRDKKAIDALIGFEYREGCWIFRSVVQRYARTEGKYATHFFFELELTGLGALGSSPISSLRQSITGYRPVGVDPTEVGRYDYYE